MFVLAFHLLISQNLGCKRTTIISSCLRNGYQSDVIDIYILFGVNTKKLIHIDMSIQNKNILIQHIVLNSDILPCLPNAKSYFLTI